MARPLGSALGGTGRGYRGSGSHSRTGREAHPTFLGFAMPLAFAGGYFFCVATLIVIPQSARNPGFRKQALVISGTTIGVMFAHLYSRFAPDRPEISGLIVTLALACLVVGTMLLHAHQNARFIRALKDAVETRTRDLRVARDRIQTMHKNLLRAERMGAAEEVAGSIAQTRDLADTSSFKVEVQCPTPAPGLLADETLLSEAMVCLLTNAIQTMPEGGRLYLDESYTAGTRMILEIPQKWQETNALPPGPA